VVFDANTATSEKIGHCRNRFTVVFGAGAHGENKVTEGKLFRLAQDLRVLFHAYVYMTAKRVPMFIGVAIYMGRLALLTSTPGPVNDRSSDTYVKI
jgi:hypothetical protein